MASSAPHSRELPQEHHVSPCFAPEQALPKPPSILLATTDSEIRANMEQLLRAYRVNTLGATGMGEIKSALANEDVAACFCGFWLVDGTYRDVVRHLKRERPQTPIIIVCAPTCPHEYRDYLAALNIRAFDFICHPYRQIDLDRILRSALALRKRPVEMPASAANPSGGSSGSSGLRRVS